MFENFIGPKLNIPINKSGVIKSTKQYGNAKQVMQGAFNSPGFNSPLSTKSFRPMGFLSSELSLAYRPYNIFGCTCIQSLHFSENSGQWKRLFRRVKYLSDICPESWLLK